MWKWVVLAAATAAIGCDDRNTEGAKGAQSSGKSYQAAHDQASGQGTADAPPVPTPAFSQASSGPGTPTVVGTTRPSEVGASAVVDAQRRAINNPAVTAATQASQQTQPGQQVQQGQQQAATQGTQVQSQIDQALQYVKEKKYDLAEKALNALDQQRASWAPATQQQYGPKIDMAKQALTAAKGGSGALDKLRGTAFPSNTAK